MNISGGIKTELPTAFFGTKVFFRNFSTCNIFACLQYFPGRIAYPSKVTEEVMTPGYQLRKEIIHLWQRFFQQIADKGLVLQLFDNIRSLILMDHGRESFSGLTGTSSAWQCAIYFQVQQDAAKCKDVIEWVFRGAKTVPDDFRGYLGITPHQAIGELNKLFRKHGYPYEFVACRKLLKVCGDKKVQKKIGRTIEFTTNPLFEASHEAYLSAWEYATKGNNHAAVSQCLSAFEYLTATLRERILLPYMPESPARKIIFLVLKYELDDALPAGLYELATVLEQCSGGNQFPVNKPLLSATQTTGILYLTSACMLFLLEQYYAAVPEC